MNRFRFLGITLIAVLVMLSCKKDDEVQPQEQDFGYPDLALSTNLLITNEGNFLNSNASVDFLTFSNNKLINAQKSVFKDVNNVDGIGDVLQSALVNDSLIFLIVNNSNKVRIVNKNTFKEVKELNANQPRYMVKVSESKAYLSEWGPFTGYVDDVKIIDLETLTITGNIDLGVNRPEYFELVNGKVYVTCGGGFGGNEKVVVIDPNTDMVTKMIDVFPNSIGTTVDANNDLWVMSIGSGSGGSLVKVDLSTDLPVDTINTGNLGSFNNKLLNTNSAKDILYFLTPNGLYALDVNDLASNQFIASSAAFIPGSFRGFGIAKSDNDVIFVGKNNFASNIKQNGIEVYSQNQSLLYSFQSGIGPNGFYFFE
ncbi:MAG: DUF5074 domain-containing protein [Cyclobacteriaceae bacterium]